MKLAVFDFDSTLMDGETINIIARQCNVEEKVADITEKAMQGKMDFFESLVTRVSLLKDINYSKVEKICNNLPLMNGAKETIAELKKAGIKVVCFSGGFKTATVPACKYLGIDADFSNILHHKNGLLTGQVGGEMMFNDSKGEMLVRLQHILNIHPEETISVGDGANDLSMFKHSGIRVAFCAKEVLKKEASITIDNKDLTELINKLNI